MCAGCCWHLGCPVLGKLARKIAAEKGARKGAAEKGARKGAAEKGVRKGAAEKGVRKGVVAAVAVEKGARVAAEEGGGAVEKGVRQAPLEDDGWEVNDAKLEHLQEHRKRTGSAAVEPKSPIGLAPISRDARSPFSWLTVSTSNGIETKVPLDVQTKTGRAVSTSSGRRAICGEFVNRPFPKR